MLYISLKLMFLVMDCFFLVKSFLNNVLEVFKWMFCFFKNAFIKFLFWLKWVNKCNLICE